MEDIPLEDIFKSDPIRLYPQEVSCPKCSLRHQISSLHKHPDQLPLCRCRQCDYIIGIAEEHQTLYTCLSALQVAVLNLHHELVKVLEGMRS